MRLALSNTFPLNWEQWTFVEKPHSTPDIHELGHNWHISLSHSKGLIAFSLAQFRHGIDIELQDQSREIAELFSMILSDDEKVKFYKSKRLTQECFYRTWSAKEAWFKSLPAEKQAYSTLSSLSLIQLFEEGEFNVFETELQKHSLAVVAPASLPITVEAQLVDIEGGSFSVSSTKVCLPAVNLATFLP